MDEKELIGIIRAECVPTAGCTDPGCVALATATARHQLGRMPETVRVTVSPNIYKNGVSVGIPATHEHGLDLAAALGAGLDCCQDGLAVLSHVTPAALDAAKAMVAHGNVTVEAQPCPDLLYVKAEVEAAGHRATAEIAGDYTAVIRVTHDGLTVAESAIPEHKVADNPLLRYPVRELYDIIAASDGTGFSFLKGYAEINWAAAESDLSDPAMKLGPVLRASLPMTSAEDLVQAYTAAAGEARMCGKNVPIIAITGSGNHGITDFVGVYAAAKALGADEEHTIKALAISSMITVYSKGYLQRMTAFCGCAVAASAGVAAAVVYLLGGSYQQGVHAVQSVIGCLGGMFCDGAKVSCAYKLSTAARMAVQFARLAVQDCYIPEAVGIIGPTLEETFANIGLINNPGMIDTEKEIVAAIRRNLGQGRRHDG